MFPPVCESFEGNNRRHLFNSVSSDLFRWVTRSIEMRRARASLSLSRVSHYVPRQSRTTVLQLIAAVITIAVLAVLHQWLDWFLSRMSLDYMLGVASGAVFVWLVWFLVDREERSRAAQRLDRRATGRAPLDRSVTAEPLIPGQPS